MPFRLPRIKFRNKGRGHTQQYQARTAPIPVGGGMPAAENKLVTFLDEFFANSSWWADNSWAVVYLIDLGVKVGRVLKNAAMLIPPVALAINIVATLWDVGHTLFFGKQEGKEETIPTKTEKVFFAVVMISTLLIGFFIPPLGLMMFVVGSGSVLSRDALDLVRSVREYFLQSQQLEKILEEVQVIEKSIAMLQAMQGGSIPAFQDAISALEKKLEEAQTSLSVLQEKHAQLRKEIPDKAVQMGLSVVALVGAVLLFTPAAPIGIILLLVSVLGGIAYKAATFVGDTIRSRIVQQGNHLDSTMQTALQFSHGNVAVAHQQLNQATHQPPQQIPQQPQAQPQPQPQPQPPQDQSTPTSTSEFHP